MWPVVSHDLLVTYLQDGMGSSPSFCPFLAQLLLKHVRLVHSCDPNFRIQCSVEGCLRTFTDYRTYQNHLLQHGTEPVYIISNSMVEIEGENDDDDLECFQGPQCTHINMKDYATLKTCESQYLTHTAMLGVINDVTDMIHVIVESYYSNMTLTHQIFMGI